MAFPESVISRAWRHSLCQCEKCSKSLVEDFRGMEIPGGWEVHHKNAAISGDEDTLSNCEILCRSCYKEQHYLDGG